MAKEKVRVALIHNDSLITLVNNNGVHHLPGGTRNNWERLETAITRCTMEDIGCHMFHLNLYMSYEPGKPYKPVYIFEADIGIFQSARIMKPREYREIAHIPRKDYKDYRLAPYLEAYLERHKNWLAELFSDAPKRIG